MPAVRPADALQTAGIVTSRNSDVYHVSPNCRYAKRIKPETLVTGAGAMKAGARTKDAPSRAASQRRVAMMAIVKELSVNRGEAERRPGMSSLAHRRPIHLGAALTALILALTIAPTTWAEDNALPRPDHIVIVVEENKGYDDIVGSASAPYITSLAAQGALLTFYSLHHPSQPNYIEFFAGTNEVAPNHPVCDDTCLLEPSSVPSLGGALKAKGLTFGGYAEGLPVLGAGGRLIRICQVRGRNYVLKHCPWIDFSDVDEGQSFDFTRFPSEDAGFSALPRVAMVTPNLVDDMHSLALGQSGDIPEKVKNGDQWLQARLSAYARWAMTHNSLLVITWDENSDMQYTVSSTNCPVMKPPANRIATVVVGENVKPGSGRDGSSYSHYDLLRTIEDMYGLPHLGHSEGAKDITGIWK
jgi:hypothetical protein